MSQRSLENSQKEKLKNFMSCIDSSNKKKAITFLEMNDWDVDRAALDYFTKNPPKEQKGIVGSVFSAIGGVFGGIYHYTTSIFTRKSNKDEVKDGVERFKNTFSTQCPNFLTINFSKALQKCRLEKKLLFVYIHDSRKTGRNQAGLNNEQLISQDVFDFCRTVLTKSNVVEFLNENFVCWMTDINSKDAKTISRQIRVTQFPFVFTAVSARNNSWSNLFSFGGRIDEQHLMSALVGSLHTYNEWMSENTVRELALQDSKSLIQQQDDEYNKTSKRDLLNLEEKDRREQKIQENEKNRLEIIKALPKEPLEGSEGVIVFIIVLPDGSALNRRFLEADTVNDLYMLVDSKGLKKKGQTDLLEECEFKILSVFPRREYERENKTLKEAGFAARAKVIVEFCN